MQAVLKVMGAKKGTAVSPAGLADFIATGFSCYSRNRQTGDELVRTGQCNLQSEGVSSFSAFMTLLNGETAPYPLVHALKRVLVDHEDACLVFDSFFHETRHA
jgi:glycerol-3-phosphate dehydrogenase